jgi:hypothetical protein
MSSPRRSTPTIGVGAACPRSTIAAGAQRRDDLALAVDLFVALTVAWNHSRPTPLARIATGVFFDVIAAGRSFGGNREHEIKARHCS